MDRTDKKKASIMKLLLLLVLFIAVGIVIYKFTNTTSNNIGANEQNASVNFNIIEENDIKGMNKVDSTKNINSFGENNTTNEINRAELGPAITGEKLGSKGLPIFMYHFFYDKSKGEYAKDGNWIEVSNFESQLEYLVENDFYFPTWQEVSAYIDGKIDLPKKSVVLTVDDGEETFFKTALPVIEKYNVKITQFLVTSWNGWFKDDYPAKQVSYQSHSDNMHKSGSDGKGVMTSWSYEQILNDCKESRRVLDNKATVFCYPFGQFNNTSKKAVKDAGFELAFTTEEGRVKVGSDKLALPRVRTSTRTSLDVFKNLVN